jgi:pyruvate/2-oxoglutarate dehydrogenase complex dihydrolipoamide acyltransferase (E2) component
MSREVKIPKWGLTIEKMTILEWLKDIGDQVDQGEALCEVETDKANSEIESPVAGKLVELRGEVGTEYLVGEVIAVIDTE